MNPFLKVNFLPQGASLVGPTTTVLPHGASPASQATLLLPWVPKETVAEATDAMMAMEAAVMNCILVVDFEFV